jgi:thiol reductant ABC exporter CydD subunit
MAARAFDPRLVRAAPATRAFIGVSVLVGTLAALLLIAQAWLLAEIVSGAFVTGDGVAQLSGHLELLLGVVLARMIVAWAAPVAASRSSTRAKSQLRAALLGHSAAIGADGLARQRTGEVAVLATRGIDALDGYFALYLPQLCLAVIVPVAVLVAIAVNDWISAAIIAGTLPLIPLFMALVGASTRERMDQQLRVLQRLAGHFLDVVAGLPTLKVFGRAKAQIAAIGEITDRYRRAAMATLRVSFLSSLILELVATISVALVAVAVGLRLMGGHLDLQTGLFVLVLAPEAYLPLRQLGANYHASVEGMAAAEQAFALLERPRRVDRGRAAAPDPARNELCVESVTVIRPGSRPVLRGFSMTVEPGETLALTGPSGCGKSTLIDVLLGLLTPTEGTVTVGGVPLADLELATWHARLAWVPQRPHLFAASIGENIRVGRPRASGNEVWQAAAAAGLGDVVGANAAGLDAQLGERGAGLSAGERQRVALARAFLRDAPLLLLDEPTASLDGATEGLVLDAVRALLPGRTAVLVAHRPALTALADRVLSLDPAAVTA